MFDVGKKCFALEHKINFIILSLNWRRVILDSSCGNILEHTGTFHKCLFVFPDRFYNLRL